jgi:hypothetical protein
MSTHGTAPVTVYATVGMHAGMGIEAKLPGCDAEAVEINIGAGPELVIDCADVESLELLSAAAIEGARLLRKRIEENRSAAVQARAGEADRLTGAGVPR